MYRFQKLLETNKSKDKEVTITVLCLKVQTKFIRPLLAALLDGGKKASWSGSIALCSRRGFQQPKIDRIWKVINLRGLERWQMNKMPIMKKMVPIKSARPSIQYPHWVWSAIMALCRDLKIRNKTTMILRFRWRDRRVLSDKCWLLLLWVWSGLCICSTNTNTKGSHAVRKTLLCQVYCVVFYWRIVH